ncbi:KilA-N domain-containing protein [Mucilaginibacter sp. SJ]|uniref:KilA-N domain-containing protein n=1 Tax=Mucilaginibacter sp. SJ TaxID=3029053 RepID=UPI0023A937F7|nr:KilA-N domain-containing protein [Mucilaginibacter sp. SJ]WEA02305.1 KilA-N domain-containing protein [Mucilaginibacter sp. SJ]
MSEQKDLVINYQGSSISLFSDDRDDYISLTDIYKAWNKYSKSINAWLKTKQTLEFLNVWEKKNNLKYQETQLSQAMKIARERNGLSAQEWIRLTNATGIFTRSGERAGTYAHKDIAIRFSAWLSPEFEMFLIDEIKRLKTLEEQKNNFQLLTHDEVLSLVKLKEIFKYVAHQALVEDAHRDVFSAQSSAKNTLAEFHRFRNDILDIAPSTIDDRIKQYCLKHEIPLTNKMLTKTKREKILMLDSYDAVKHAVWDFLSINGEVNALSLADLVSNMMRIEKGEIYRKNEDDLFRQKENLGEFNDFEEIIKEHPKVKTAREVLHYRQLSHGKSRSSSIGNLAGLMGKSN